MIIRINYKFVINKLFYLFACLGLNDKTMCKTIALSIAERAVVWTNSEGLAGITRFKALSNVYIRAIMGLTLDKTLPYKYPRKFSRALVLSKKSYLARLYWVTVFSFHRLVVIAPSYDVSTILGRFTGSLFSLVRKKFWTKLLSTCCVFTKHYRIEALKPFTFKWAISGSAGPNGSPAYEKFLEDIYAVSQITLSVKLFWFTWVLPVVNKRHMYKTLSELWLWVCKDPSRYSSKKTLHSRLAFLSDKGGKTRVVAIIDILSQSLLKPVHGHMNSILRKIPMDGTFDQDLQRERVKRWSEEELHLSSIDLTACTDRFPSLLQALVLWKCSILTFWQAFWWWQVIAGRTFRYRTGNDRTLRRIRYRVGQPMGALSSWPVMAFCHHVLVQLSYKATYPESLDVFKDYALLGDDLVIRDKSVAKNYKEILSILGMDWSPSKSFESKGLAEFAKSLFRHGEDLKPFPLALLIYRNNTFVSDVLALVKELSDRKLSTNIADLLGLYGPRSKRLATLALLSPSSRSKCLGAAFGRHQEDWSTFESLLLSQRIRYFASLENCVASTTMWFLGDPTKGVVMGSPYRQIGLDASNRYPVRHLANGTNRSPELLVGLGWTAYDPECWPQGIPNLGDRKLSPSPSWVRASDDKIHRSSLLMMDRLVPGYFWPSCNKRSWK